MTIRHPEKINKPINPIKKKPSWIRSKLTNSQEFFFNKDYSQSIQIKYCLPRSKLPKYYRVLEQKTCNIFNYG